MYSWERSGMKLRPVANTNLEFYKRVADDDAFARHFPDWLFECVEQRIKA